MEKIIKVQKYQNNKYSSRLVLPVKMCKILNIRPDDEVMAELDIEKERIVLKKIQEIE